MKTSPILLCGLVLLLISGFNAFHHVRLSLTELINNSENEKSSESIKASAGGIDELPIDIYLLLLVSFLTILYGSLSSISKFKSTKGIQTLNAQKRDEFLDRLSFRKYNHRAKEFRKRINKASPL
jgi:hypothetical protein